MSLMHLATISDQEEDSIVETVTRIEYIAKDGKVFDSEQKCLAYEKRIRDGGIFLSGNEITGNELALYLLEGYWLANYKPGRLTIFGPPPINGGRGEIYGAIADKLGEMYDLHNYKVYQLRAAQTQELL